MDRGAQAEGRLGGAGALEQRQLPNDDPDHLSPGASWVLVLA